MRPTGDTRFERLLTSDNESFGQYRFEDRAAFEVFADGQRELFNEFRPNQKVLQRNLLETLRDTGGYPPFRLPDPTESLDALLTVTWAPRIIEGVTFHRLGCLLVEEHLWQDFNQATRHCATANEQLVRSLLTGLRAGARDINSTRARAGLSVETKIVSGEKFCVSGLSSGAHDRELIITWDRRVVAMDLQNSAVVPPAIALYHEIGHAIHELYDETGRKVRCETPDAMFGHHEERDVILNVEGAFLEGLSLPRRVGHAGRAFSATDIRSARFALGVGIDGNPPQLVSVHSVNGQITQIHNPTNELIVRSGTQDYHYDLREISQILSADYFYDRAPRILRDAYEHQDVITIGINSTLAPTYENPAQRQRFANHPEVEGLPARTFAENIMHFPGGTARFVRNSRAFLRIGTPRIIEGGVPGEVVTGKVSERPRNATDPNMGYLKQDRPKHALVYRATPEYVRPILDQFPTNTRVRLTYPTPTSNTPQPLTRPNAPPLPSGSRNTIGTRGWVMQQSSSPHQPPKAPPVFQSTIMTEAEYKRVATAIETEKFSVSMAGSNAFNGVATTWSDDKAHFFVLLPFEATHQRERRIVKVSADRVPQNLRNQNDIAGQRVTVENIQTKARKGRNI